MTIKFESLYYDGREYTEEDVKSLVDQATEIYEALYTLDAWDVCNYSKYVDLFDRRMKESPEFKQLVCAMAYIRQDIYMSDRECASACLAIIHYRPTAKTYNRETVTEGRLF